MTAALRSLLASGPRSNELRTIWRAPGSPATPVELVVMRLFGAAWLVLVLLEAALNRPRPGLHGRGAEVLAALVALCACAVAAKPWSAVPAWRRAAALVGVTTGAVALAVLKPDSGSWPNGPLLVGIIAALWLARLAAIAVFGFSLLAVVTVAVIAGHPGAVLAIVFNAVPWFLVIRLVVELSAQHNALRASQAAEAEAVAVAERARLARELHDVLAHSLSALALQLESTRLLAARRGAHDEITRAIDRAHQLAALGLEEARRAIAAARGDDVPGPDRIETLAGAFEQQSGLPVAVAVHGEPHPLAPDARLAVYRTVQEALTNVRRHAVAERVEITLSYLPRGTTLVVEDVAPMEAPPPVAPAGNGYGLTGMRERAELLGGRLVARPTGTGFRVELELPA